MASFPRAAYFGELTGSYLIANLFLVVPVTIFMQSRLLHFTLRFQSELQCGQWNDTCTWPFPFTGLSTFGQPYYGHTSGCGAGLLALPSSLTFFFGHLPHKHVCRLLVFHRGRDLMILQPVLPCPLIRSPFCLCLLFCEHFPGDFLPDTSTGIYFWSHENTVCGCPHLPLIERLPIHSFWHRATVFAWSAHHHTGRHKRI